MNSLSMNRRVFIMKAGIGTAAMVLSPNGIFPQRKERMKKVRMGIIGGGFGLGFQFHEHPGCIVEAVSDLNPERRNDLKNTYHCTKSYESLEKLN